MPDSFVPLASKGCSSEKGQLVGVLHDSRHSNRPTPVVVEMTELERKSLHLVRIQRIPVPDDVVVCWAHRPLTSSLGDEEEFPTEK